MGRCKEVKEVPFKIGKIIMEEYPDNLLRDDKQIC